MIPLFPATASLALDKCALEAFILLLIIVELCFARPTRTAKAGAPAIFVIIDVFEEGQTHARDVSVHDDRGIEGAIFVNATFADTKLVHFGKNPCKDGRGH